MYFWSIHNDEIKIDIKKNRCREIGGTFYSLINFEISMFQKELVSTILFLISILSYYVACILLRKLRNIDILIHETERTIRRSLSSCYVHIRLKIQDVSFPRLKDTMRFHVFQVAHIIQMYKLSKGTNKCPYLMFCWPFIAIHPYNMNQ